MSQVVKSKAFSEPLTSQKT